MREEGITVDKVMDLVTEKVRGGVTKKNGRQPVSVCDQILNHEDEVCVHYKQNLVESI